MTKGKEIAIPEKFAVMEVEGGIEQVQALLEENLGGEELTPFDLERIKVPSGGMTVWEYPTLEGLVTVPAISGVIVTAKAARSYWKDTAAIDGTPPDCSSEDGNIGIGDPGGECRTCPLNEFGSSKKEGSKGKACKETRNVFFLTESGMLPFSLQVPPTSLKSFKSYARRLVQEGLSINGVVTTFTLEKKTGGGHSYGEIQFSFARKLDDKEYQMIRGYRKTFEEVLQRTPFDRIPDE